MKAPTFICKFCGQHIHLHGVERAECPNGKKTTYQPRKMTRTENKEATRNGWLR